MRRTLSKLVIVGAALALIIGINVLITGQPASKLRRQAASQHLVGVPDDWSHHHLVFSNPGTYEQVAKDPAAYAKWLTIRYDTRFILQQMKRHAEATGGFSRETRTGGEEAVSPSGMVEPEDLAIGVLRQRPVKPIGPSKPTPMPAKLAGLKRDWSEPLLTGTVQPNAYPAKWGASLTSADCVGDFVVYPTGMAGSATAANIVAYNNLYSGCGGTVPSVYWAYNTGGTISTSPIISLDGSQVAFIQSDGTTADLFLLRVQGSTGETTTSPVTPIYESNSDYRGYAQLPCMTALIFSYGTGLPYPNDTYSAPFYDYDDDVLYVGDDAGYLHKFTGVFNGTPTEAGSPWPVKLNPTNTGHSVKGTLSNANTSDSPGVTLTSGTFSSADVGALISDSTTSSDIPTGDTIASIVSSTEALLAVAPTTATDQTLTITDEKVTSPANDPVSGYVFVGDTGGYLYSVGTGTGSPTTTDGKVYGTSDQLGDVIIDAPLVDSSAQMVYAFVTTDSSTKNAVFQFPTSFTSGSGSIVEVGAGNPGFYLYAGDFDNVYYSSTNGTAGNLWVMGNTGTAGGNLYRIPISAAGAMESPEAMITGLTDTTTGQYPWPSPITEFCNQTIASTPCGASGGVTTGGTDYIFFSVDKLATAQGTCTTGSGAGCVLAYTITDPTSPTLSGSFNVTTPGTPGCWATGGIVIDNSDTTTTGASQVYFINLNGNNPGGPTGNAVTSSECATGTSATIQAVQASQSGLH